MFKKTLTAVVATSALMTAGLALADKPGAGWITIAKTLEWRDLRVPHRRRIGQRAARPEGLIRAGLS